MPGQNAIVLGLTLLLSVGGCGPEEPPAVTAPPEPADAVPWPDLVWTDADLPAAPRGLMAQHIAAVAADASGFVAVGFQDSAAGHDGLAWFSGDGRSWEEAVLPEAVDPVTLLDVAAGVGGFVALGSATGDAGPMTVLYLSDDGQRWERVAFPAGANSYPSSLAGGPGGYLVAGNAGDGGSAAWTSVDGRTWERVAREAMADGRPGVIDPLATGVGWVALGSNVQAPAFLRSRDGIAWTANTIEPGADTTAQRLVTGRWGYVVQGGRGSCGPFSSCPTDGVNWWSGDGEAWTRLPHEGALEFDGSLLVAAGDHGIIGLFGSSVWSSMTGWSWTSLPGSGDDDAAVNAAAVRDGVIVLAGERYLENSSTARIVVAE